MKRVFSLLRVNSTFMTTSFNRMFDVNKILMRYIKGHFSKELKICDFAVSSGQSTLELFQDLKLNNINKIYQIYGFDKKIYITMYMIGKFIFLYSANNELLMIEFNKRCMRYRWFLFFKKIEKLIPIFFNRLNLLDFINIRYKKSKLLIPSLEKFKELKFFEEDIFNINKKYFNFFDVIRVSNLLNYSYFSKSQIRKAILNIKKISKENSIIVVNRTPNKKKKIQQAFLLKR